MTESMRLVEGKWSKYKEMFDDRKSVDHRTQTFSFFLSRS